ncbi:protein cueball-like isoform X3 [Portunus trituberculatus]|uniref:protein cueball-like isoform X3 n=1 Tax=Portunus trituberculatus TaxID=210409 RepID=UPI001E1D0134|nr:protein cueball-like isoform X3 [Portunus trituberculatus]
MWRGSVSWLAVVLSFVSSVLSTDLAAVYRDSILILHNADIIHPDSLSWKDISVELPKPLSSPVALTHDAETNRLFVANTDPRDEAKIISISLNSTFGVVNMTTAVKSRSTSSIEGMSYSPRSKHIYWTETHHYNIYKASIQSDDSSYESTPELISNTGNPYAPRGLAVDVCNEHLYWSELGNERNVPSSVEMWNPESNKHDVFRKAEEKDFYQGLTFDDTTRTLVWAVTHGNDLDSSCRIVSYSVDDDRHQDLVQLEKCHPFSLTVDENYVYWADWSREGIMRASKSDPNNVTRILDTPPDKRMSILGAYGIAKLNVGKMVQMPCQDKKDESHHEDKSVNNDERFEGVAEIKETQNGSSDNVESVELKKERDDQKTDEEIVPESADDMESKDVHIKVEEIKPMIPEHTTTEHSDTKNDKNNVDVKTFKDRTMLNGFQTDSPSIEPQQKINQESADTATNTYNDETQTDSLASLSTYGVAVEECVPRYNYLAMIVVLAATTVMFLCSTIILAVLLYRRRATSCKGISVAAIETPQKRWIGLP